MWLSLAFLSAALLGLYDVAKKASLKGNAVIPVLFCNTLICTLLFLPLILAPAVGVLSEGHWLHVPNGSLQNHLFALSKGVLVLSSWICGYYAIKQLPLTIVGPINATRPVLTLIGAMTIFGERLNAWQWSGVAIAILSFYMLSRSGKKEGISFSRNRSILLLIGAALLGACSGLYDKFLMSPVEHGGLGVDRMFLQSWFYVYQTALMSVALFAIWWPKRRTSAPFQWRWSIPLISLFIAAADLAYFYALTDADALIAIVSMIRRSSVIVSFAVGGLFFHEKNLRSKALDLALVLLSMLLIYIGTR